MVEDVGENVKGVKKGDEVLAIFSAGDERKAAFQATLPPSAGRGESIVDTKQDYVALPEQVVGVRPKSWSAEDAASLPSVSASVCIHDDFPRLTVRIVSDT